VFCSNGKKKKEEERKSSIPRMLIRGEPERSLEERKEFTAEGLAADAGRSSRKNGNVLAHHIG
jgi:hypothetical protein